MSAADPAETIDGGESVSRLVDDPRTYTVEKGLIWETLFQFPHSQHESVVWRRYAPDDLDVHAIGCERERSRRGNPDRSPQRYAGFITAKVCTICAIRNVRGHGFRVDHLPAEGLHHAGISYAPVPGGSLNKNDKTELKVYLWQAFKAFGPMTPCQCDDT